MEQVEATQEKEYIYAPVIHLQIVRDKDMKAPRYIRKPSHVADLLMEHYGSLDREVLVVIHLNTRNQIMSIEPIATGSVNGMGINMRELFKGAILANATSIIIAHNHPSGETSPSPEDVAMTRKVQQAGNLLGVEVLDHLVVGYRNFASLKELGLID
jgi:DNA repair protein RadC